MADAPGKLGKEQGEDERFQATGRPSSSTALVRMFLDLDDGHLIDDFDRKGEKLVKGVLGSINPAFAHTVDMLFDMNDGLKKVSASMLGLTAAGVGIGVLVSAIQTLMGELEGVRRQLEEMEKRKGAAAVRDAGIRAEVLDRMKLAGLQGDSLPAVLRKARESWVRRADLFQRRTEDKRWTWRYAEIMETARQFYRARQPETAGDQAAEGR